MRLHKEGAMIIPVGLGILALIEVLNYMLFVSTGWLWLFLLLTFGVIVMAYLIVQFFRVPKRVVSASEFDVMCPADGKVVVIEEVEETEYFKDKRIQVSIFMSPLNVHVNWSPIAGIINYVKYHPGLFLVAWHPKSSTDNERTTVVVQHASGQEVLFRQIAGAVARRICYYVEEKQSINVGGEFGFIKFGSRVDLFLPLDTKIDLKIGDVVTGKVTRLGELKH